MMTFLKIICIWISCIICLFGRLQLSTVEAAAFEYYDDHEQLSYDLDAEQSKAKYDTRLLSQQLLKAQQSSEAAAMQIDKNVDYHTDDADFVDGADGADDSVSDGKASKQYNNYNKHNERDDNNDSDEVADDDDDGGGEAMQPHERAASCFTGRRKYTHGQKIPRFDPCEVCLCMDGEIFCWWEKCTKKRHQITVASSTETNNKKTTYHGHTIETTTTRLKPTTTKQQTIPFYTTTTNSRKNMNKQKGKAKAKKSNQQMFINQNLKQQKKQKLKQKQQLQERHEQHAQQQQQQQHQKHDKHHRAHEIDFEHYSARNKILNFPENLPSILYSDYKTEEHEHLQHQHHQKHLKHQLLQQQQLKRFSSAQQKQQIENATTTTTSTSALGTSSMAALSTALESIYDVADTDSDILPEPPTKRPKIYLNTFSDRTKPTLPTEAEPLTAAGTLPTTATAHTQPLTAAVHKNGNILITPQNTHHNNNNNYNNAESSTEDDAFHRWLTSTETNNNKTQNFDERYYDYFNNSTIIAAYDNSTNNNSKSNDDNNNTLADDLKLTQIAANAILRSTLNEYNNGSLINIDISLVTDEEDRQQQQTEHEQGPYNEQKEQLIEQQQWNENHDYRAELKSTNCNSNATTNVDCVKDIKTTKPAAAAATTTHLNNTALDATIATALTTPTATATPTITLTTTTEHLKRQCNVMGTIYNIGDVLPQDTGNCLQCVCTESYKKDDIPRVTCSPHNCPPLVLPDLLDATGY